MKFTEELAQKLAAENNVSAATVATWKHRGEIPEKYFRKNYSKTTYLDEEHQLLSKKILTILSLKEINASAYAGGLSYRYKINEVKAGKTQFTAAEIDGIVLKIKELRLEISKLLRDDRKFLDSYFEKQVIILKREEIVITHTLSLGGVTKEEYTKIRGFIDNRRGVITEQKIIDKITDSLKKLYVLINV